MVRQSPVAPPMIRRAAPTNSELVQRPADETAVEVGRNRAKRTLPPVELGPIIKSKIQPPALRASTLSRQRLIDH